MIGELINNFDNRLDNNLEAFNKTFNTDIIGDKNAKVEIGEMLVGGLREVFINGKARRMVLNNPNLNVERGRYAAGRPSNYVYVVSKEEVTKQFLSITDISRFLNREISHIHGSIDKQKIDGWSIRKYLKETDIDRNERKKELPSGQGYQGRSGKYVYECEDSDGNKVVYSNLSRLSRELDIGRTTLESRFSKGGHTETKVGDITVKRMLR